jgi:haloacetate dehalogenase
VRAAGLYVDFEVRDVETSRGAVHAVVGGHGPPVLLLHGYPQSLVMWRGVAPLLAERHTVVATDLAGYGASFRPVPATDHAPHGKRAMALDQIEAMAALGFDRFTVAGHDRGGRVAYRIALDHPDAVERLAVLDVWRPWAPAVHGRGLDGSHFLPEDCPEIVASELLAFTNQED